MAATYYLIRGIEPPDLKTYPDHIKELYWGWVVELGLKAKDRELAQGLDRHGKPLRDISIKTRKHRRSAMTATGKGDPSAPPLMPGRGLSRTRSLLAGRARRNYAEFYWRYDPWTHDTWGKVLAHHAKRGRDVIGISPQAVARIQAQALVMWQAWKRANPWGEGIVVRKVASMSPVKPVAQPKPQRASPWRTIDEWERLARQRVSQPRRPGPGVSASVRGGAVNRLLAWIWGQAS